VDRILSHDELRDLLGAYALDAVEADEAEAVRAHLAGCPRCAAEVAEHLEVAGLIANAGVDAPEEIWTRIAASLGDGADAAAEAGVPPLAPLRHERPGPRPGARRRRALGRTSLGAVAAAVVALVVVLAVQVHHLDGRVGQMAAAAQHQGLDQAVQAALLDPGARRVTLTGTGGTGRAAVLVLLPDGSGFALNTALPPIGSGRTYQLWGFVRGVPVSLALLGNHPAQVPFTVSPGVTVTGFAVTDEAAGGAVRPTGTPLARSTTAT